MTAGVKSDAPIIGSAGTRALYVHGLLMTGMEGLVLARRLARAGIATEAFAYRSLREPPAQAAARLGARLRDDADIAVVGHSLGGVLALAAIARAPAWRGRAVLLGPPLAGSATARRVSGLHLGRPFLGAAGGLLTAPAELVAADRRIAVISGMRNLGIGALLGVCPPPGDGVVRLRETRLPGAVHALARCNHFGLLFDRRVAAAAAAFIRAGRLPRPRRPARTARKPAPAPRAD